MELAVATIVNMLILSSMYILTALGFAFLFNMLRILNLAHGAIYMIGGYIGYIFIFALGFNHWLSPLRRGLQPHRNDMRGYCGHSADDGNHYGRE
jgi:branched-chain amino acid transport system permease protein